LRLHSTFDSLNGEQNQNKSSQSDSGLTLVIPAGHVEIVDAKLALAVPALGSRILITRSPGHRRVLRFVDPGSVGARAEMNAGQIANEIAHMAVCVRTK